MAKKKDQLPCSIQMSWYMNIYQDIDIHCLTVMLQAK